MKKKQKKERKKKKKERKKKEKDETLFCKNELNRLCFQSDFAPFYIVRPRYICQRRPHPQCPRNVSFSPDACTCHAVRLHHPSICLFVYLFIYLCLRLFLLFLSQRTPTEKDFELIKRRKDSNARNFGKRDYYLLE